MLAEDEAARKRTGVLPVALSDGAVTALRYLVIALSCLLVLLFVKVAKTRVGYPFELDWIEDGILTSVQHIREGLPLYGPPSSQFTPYLYTPIYLYGAALLSHVTGISYAPLREISVMATFGCFAALYAFVFAETRRHVAAIAAVGAFAACFPVTRIFDSAHVDMLYLCFVLWALYATRRMHPVVAALLWVCAFQTKQGVLPVALLMLCHDWPQPRRVLAGVGAFAAGMVISIVWLNHVFSGWYRLYVFGLAGGLGLDMFQGKRYLTEDLLAVYAVALVVAAAALLFIPGRWRGRGFSFYVLGTVGMVGYTGFIRAHAGANVNSLLPAYAWISLIFGVALGRLTAWLGNSEQQPFARAGTALVLLAACVQLGQHFYSPTPFAPKPDSAAKREAFLEQLRSIPGNVLVASHPAEGAQAGKGQYAGTEATGLVVDAKNHTQGDLLLADIARLLRGGTLTAVVLDGPVADYLAHPRVWLPRDFAQTYPLRVAAKGTEDPQYGQPPRWIFLPCSQQAVAMRLDPQVDTAACAAR